MKNLYVRNLMFETTEETIERLFTEAALSGLTSAASGDNETAATAPGDGGAPTDEATRNDQADSEAPDSQATDTTLSSEVPPGE